MPFTFNQGFILFTEIIIASAFLLGGLFLSRSISTMLHLVVATFQNYLS